MAVVLASEDDRYFGSSSLRRSHSQHKFLTKSASFHTVATARTLNESYTRPPLKTCSDSAPSSAPSSPAAINPVESDISYVSTPASNVSLSTASDCDDTIQLPIHPSDHFVPPDYSQAHLLVPAEDLEPPTSPKTGHSYPVSPAENEISTTTTSRPGTPELIDHAEDDTAVKARPTRHVDYLSHEWTEEEIWSSWRYIVSRRGEYPNSARLENASWRQWLKAKYKLRTVSPETLNWLKDCDVTWLYGPIQGARNFDRIVTTPSSSRLSKSSSFLHKKPILKKRSMSEIMLQRSISTSSLLKQATAAVVAQETQGGRMIGRPGIARSHTDFGTFPFNSRRMSKNTSLLTSNATSSGALSPVSERKRIHFNEKVEQCIAVDIKGDDDEEDAYIRDDWDSDEDDAIMMKRSKSKKKRVPILRRKSTGSFHTNGKIIAKLPSTTLKSRYDEDNDSETAMKHSTKVFRSPLISPSSSQETLKGGSLRSSKAAGKFFMGSDDEDDEDDEDDLPTIRRPTPKPRAVKQDDSTLQGLGLGIQRSASSSSLTAEPAGMRRTASGMFMPVEEGEPTHNEGIFGRVIDTVNTARDIAHVIWNVGWRK